MFIRLLLRSIVARFPEQVFKGGLLSRGSLGKYSMIDCFLGDAFGVKLLKLLLILLDRVVSGASFLTGDVIKCDLT